MRGTPLQISTLFTFDLDLGVMVIQNNAQHPPHHVTYDLPSLKLLHPLVLEMHLQENTLFDLDIRVTLNIAQHPLHIVTYAMS